MTTALVIKKPAHLEISLKPNVWVDPSKMLKQITDAGYAAREDEIRFTLTGKFTKEGDVITFVLSDIKSEQVSLLITAYKGKDEKRTKENTDAMKSGESLIGQKLEVEGDWLPPPKKQDKDKRSSASFVLVKVKG